MTDVIRPMNVTPHLGQQLAAKIASDNTDPSEHARKVLSHAATLLTASATMKRGVRASKGQESQACLRHGSMTPLYLVISAGPL